MTILSVFQVCVDVVIAFFVWIIVMFSVVQRTVLMTFVMFFHFPDFLTFDMFFNFVSRFAFLSRCF